MSILFDPLDEDIQDWEGQIETEEGKDEEMLLKDIKVTYKEDKIDECLMEGDWTDEKNKRFSLKGEIIYK